MMRVSVVLALCLAAVPAPAALQAQTQAPRTAKLLVTVADQSGAVIPEATVTIVGLDAATRVAATPPVKTAASGIAAIDGLAPGRYSITAEFPGFELGLLRDVRLRSGDNKHLVILPLKKMETEVTVGRDAQTAASDRLSTFGTAMTREQIEALSDDPAEMQRQLEEMAGPNAVLRVDSFEGSQLPPKSQIKSIHITRDAFAAENHSAGGLFIDIITQPGVGPIRGGGNARLRDGSMSGRNQFAPSKGPERSQNYSTFLSGSLLKNRSGFSLSVNGGTAFDTPNSYVAVPGVGTVSKLLPRRPSDNLFVSGLLDYAITRDQTLRLSVNKSRFTSENQGIGGSDEAERAYSTENSGITIRIQEAGPLGRRFFTNTRVSIGRQTTDSQSVLEALTFRVADSLTTGGAQVKGGRKSTTVNLQSDLDYVRGIHSVRTGINLDGGSYHSDDSANYLGTYFFESTDAFAAGTPRTYTQRIGDPNITYDNVYAGLYVQDDIRVRKNLTLSPGLRYELQTHLSDYSNLGPRFGLTWSPFKNGKTSLRGSAGVFYDWLGTGTYEQTLRVDGFRQRDLNISNPSFPNPGNVGDITAGNRYLLTDGLPMVRNVRFSAGIDQTISPRVRVNATYANTRGSGLLRGNNLNAPINGVRPNPAFVNVVEVVADAESRQHNLSVSGFVSLSAQSSPAAQLARLGAPPAAATLFDWKRTTLNFNYSTGRFRNNTDGAFSLPASGSPLGEWGEVAGEIRHHRGNLGINTQALRNLNANLSLNVMSGTPYTITTGRDNNGDLVFNDRPAGVGRNTLWTPGQWTLSGFLNYSISIGKRTAPPPGGITGISITNGVPTVLTGGAAQPRYRLGISAQIQNLTNHENLTGFSGNMASDFFRRATNAQNPRKVDIGLNFQF